MEPHVPVNSALDDLPSLEAGEEADVPDHKARNHQQSTVEKYDALDEGEVPYDGFSPRRLPAEEPSYTITVSQGKSPIHHEQPRMLSVREIARIQTFGDDFTIPLSTRVDKCRVVGNAVPPQLAESIANVL